MYVHTTMLTELVRQHHEELRDETSRWTRRVRPRRRTGRDAEG